MHPSGSAVRGWTPYGKAVLIASNRDSAPSSYNRLYTVDIEGGLPKLVSAQWGHDGDYSPDGSKMIIDKMNRCDVELRAYRGGQNTPLILMDLETQKETLLPNKERSTDIKPFWLDNKVYFLSDRDLVANVWSFDTNT